MEEQTAKVLMAMTELEAATLAMLEAIDQARKAMREVMVTYRERRETAE